MDNSVFVIAKTMEIYDPDRAIDPLEWNALNEDERQYLVERYHRKKRTLDKDIQELRRRLGESAIQRAYRGIVSCMSHLQTVFAAQQGERAVSGLYQGCFDMTCFALFPDALKKRNLKLAIVFNYQTFRLEVWLAARNRQLQRCYWELLLQAWGNAVTENTVSVNMRQYL